MTLDITYFLGDNGACGYYRLELPLMTLGAQEHVNKAAKTNVKKVEKGDDVHTIGAAIDKSDIVVIPRPQEYEMLGIMKKFKELGKKIVVEFDDNMFKISPYSPHYEEFGVENVEIDFDGQVMPLWVDGKNINLTENKKRIAHIQQALEMADMVTVTTDILAEEYKEYNDNIVVLPNCVDVDLWKSLKDDFKPTDEIKLYWAGGSSHYEDWALLTGVIAPILEKYPNVKLVLMGHKFEGTLKGIPKNRIEFHSWVPTPAYPYKTRIINPDICIIPLVDNEFNRCKSSIKWVEMGALGVPCVTSLVSPYKEVANENNGVFIEDNDPGAWIEGISLLIEDSILRAKMGSEARKTVLENFNIHDKHSLWRNAYRSLK